MQFTQFDPLTKLGHHREWLRAYLSGEVVAPVSMELDLTNNCNYKCPNCEWTTYRGDGAVFPGGLLPGVLSDLARSGVKAVIFSGGGEPLIHPAAVSAIQGARRLGLEVGIFTNGLALTEEVAKVLVETTAWVRIHLDAATQESYARRHGLAGNGLGRVLTNVSRLSRLVASRGAYLSLGIGAVVNPDTFPDLAGLARLARETGCDYFQAKHDFHLMPSSEYLRWWDTTVVPALDALSADLGAAGFRLQYLTRDYTRRPRATRCHIHHLAMALTADGRVVFCKRLRQDRVRSVGNLIEQALLDVLRGQRSRRLSLAVTPENCGVICPYFHLNETLETMSRTRWEVVAAGLGPADQAPPLHVNFL